MPARTGSKFKVDLGGLKLPAATERRIAAEIRRIVLREIGKVDLKGDLQLLPGIRIGPGTMGLIARFRRGVG